ncbi:GlxA family transcriptional regulator [Actinoallomurus rhizosphaericola]|uniref:GlxA family transcriptional regulator n=1 Tax=Actinoallomurus rhizosphaericola TaxID=2952536 RepID=UPI002093C3EE|nr:helix-turn-helix domain-containing protein [Actinoallomurus rhizosphaericola]MCO5999608.1 helix-turn-helix domain-containing protein [Actinoallomurus rhizosphaericola]
MTHEVVVLAVNEVVAFDLGVPSQIFGAARDAGGRPYYRVRVCTPDGGPVRTSAGFRAVPDHGPEILAAADSVVVPGVHGGAALEDGVLEPPLAAALALRRPDTRLMSICTGAFVLAAAGVLDGRPATTHWAHADRFRALHPTVRLDPGVLFVDDGDVLTSAGVGAGVDLCLHVIRRDHGSAVANRAARRSVMPPWREGGQSQFIERPLPATTGASTAETRAWALERLQEPLDLARLARRAGMSVRTFTRRFRAETGLSPAQWLIRQRIEEARRLLETTDLPIDQVAERAGLGTAASLRQHLHAAVGVSPATYRRTFGVARV